MIRIYDYLAMGHVKVVSHSRPEWPPLCPATAEATDESPRSGVGRRGGVPLEPWFSGKTGVVLYFG